jgi:hypothetical protein
LFADDLAAIFFRFGKAGRVQKQIFETGSSFTASDNAQNKQAGKTKNDPLTRPDGHLLPAWRGEGQGKGRNHFRIRSVFHGLIQASCL